MPAARERNPVNLLHSMIILLLLCLADYAPRSNAWSPTTTWVVPLGSRCCRPRRAAAARSAESNCSNDIGIETTKGKRRKQKKNKYAKFSKADQLSQDPLDSLISESREKIRQIELETARRRNTAIPKAQRNEERTRNRLEFPDIKTIDPYDPATYGYTELGTIVGAHGVRGLVKIAAVTDFPERLCRPGLRHLKPHNRRAPREIQLLDGKHRMGDEYLVKFEGIGDRDAASKLRGAVLYARQEERPSNIAQDEYLVSDLVGSDVLIENDYSSTAGVGGKFVGTVGGIVLAQEMCAIPGLGHDMLEVVLPRGRGGLASWRDEMVLIPLVPEIVPRVDLTEKKIYITPPNGLLDLTYVREEKVRIKGFLPPAEC